MSRIVMDAALAIAWNRGIMETGLSSEVVAPIHEMVTLPFSGPRDGKVVSPVKVGPGASLLLAADLEHWLKDVKERGFVGVRIRDYPRVSIEHNIAGGLAIWRIEARLVGAGAL